MRWILLTTAALTLTTPTWSDETAQTGSLSGSLGVTTTTISLEAFDPQGGTLQLQEVRLDALTSMGGGYQTTGSGVSVDVFAQLAVEYSLGTELLSSSAAVLDFNVPNPPGGPLIAVSLFDTDTDSVSITDPTALAAWIGTGTVDLTAVVDFSIVETPSGVIGFGAGGTVEYTVTYVFDETPDLPFSRGDANADGKFDIADAVATLATLFVVGSPELPCDRAADSNGDGVNDISDAVFSLSALFVPSAPLPTAPFPGCGIDPTSPLTCDSYGACP